MCLECFADFKTLPEFLHMMDDLKAEVNSLQNKVTLLEEELDKKSDSNNSASKQTSSEDKIPQLSNKINEIQPNPNSVSNQEIVLCLKEQLEKQSADICVQIVYGMKQATVETPQPAYYILDRSQVYRNFVVVNNNTSLSALKPKNSQQNSPGRIKPTIKTTQQNLGVGAISEI